MGSKGGSAPAPVQQQQIDVAAAMGPMMEMMAASNAAQMEMINNQQVPDAPDIYESPDVDWAEKSEQLRNKMHADYGKSQSKKMGRLDTVMTSPLLDDEDIATTGSVLGGDK